MLYQTGMRFIKGGVSGLISGGLLQPLQVIKTSMQVSPVEAKKYLDSVQSLEEGKGLSRKGKVYLSFTEATSLIYNREGPRGFLRGLAPSLLKNTGQAGCFFSILFYSEETLKAL